MTEPTPQDVLVEILRPIFEKAYPEFLRDFRIDDLAPFMSAPPPPDHGLVVSKAALPVWAERGISALWDPTVGTRWSWQHQIQLFRPGSGTADLIVSGHIQAPEPLLEALGDTTDEQFWIAVGAWFLRMLWGSLRDHDLVVLEGHALGAVQTYSLSIDGITIGVFDLVSRDSQARDVTVELLATVAAHHFVDVAMPNAETMARDFETRIWPKIQSLTYRIVRET